MFRHLGPWDYCPFELLSGPEEKRERRVAKKSFTFSFSQLLFPPFPNLCIFIFTTFPVFYSVPESNFIL